MENLYAKTGDAGQTGLIGGSHVKKSSRRVACYGTVDELNSLLGLAYSQLTRDDIRDHVRAIQKRLFALGLELISDEAGSVRLKGLIEEEDVTFLEGIINSCIEIAGMQPHLTLSGVDPASSVLHVARAVARRAERHMIALSEWEPVREILLRYMNRASDALYVLARLQESLISGEQSISSVEEKPPEFSLPPFSLDALEFMARRARERAAEIGVPVVFSAVDKGGNLVLLERMEGSLLGSIEVSIGKAYTANAFQMTTEALGRQAGLDGPLYGIGNSAPGKIILFGGGFPYVTQGRVAGGIGVSGGTVEQDMDIARYAMSL